MCSGFHDCTDLQSSPGHTLTLPVNAGKTDEKEYADALCTLLNTLTDTAGLAKPPCAAFLKGLYKPDEEGHVNDHIGRRARWMSIKHATGVLSERVCSMHEVHMSTASAHCALLVQHEHALVLLHAYHAEIVCIQVLALHTTLHCRAASAERHPAQWAPADSVLANIVQAGPTIGQNTAVPHDL